MNRLTYIGIAIAIVVILTAIFAELIATHDVTAQNLLARYGGPSAEHWFGTDHFGRDLLSRVMYGGRVSLTIGFFVVVATGLAGTTIGAIAGFFRRLDNPLMRLKLGSLHPPEAKMPKNGVRLVVSND